MMRLVFLSLLLTACVPCRPIVEGYERELAECLDKYEEDRDVAKLCGERVRAAYTLRLRSCRW